MGIQGIGNDIIEIRRVAQAIHRHGEKILTRLFTAAEQEYCQRHQDPFPRFSGRFAAKEAISKALGVGISDSLDWLDIEILNDARGKPCVHLSPRADQFFHQPHLLLSISHSKEYATAVCIWSCDVTKTQVK